MERNRRGVWSISSAARWLPRCNQMKMSVSNSTVSRLAKFLHHLFDGFLCFSATAEKGMATCRYAARTFLRNKPSSHFASLHDQHFFSAAQSFQDILHPVSKIDDRRFHVYENYTSTWLLVRGVLFPALGQVPACRCVACRRSES